MTRMVRLAADSCFRTYAPCCPHISLRSIFKLASMTRLHLLSSATPPMKFDSYSPSEYVMIVLDSRLGTGGTGTVFRACIEPDASSSKPKYCAPFVVKFAYSSKDVDRLRHEYAVYRHLERKGVTGIPRLLGFYEAVDQDDMAALIIAHAGRPLGELRDENHKISLKASEM